MAKKGKYIVIEGTDGTGKTTQARRLVDALVARGYDSHYVHEPGQTEMGIELEKIIKNRSLDRSALTNLLLFTADRLETYRQILQPALDAGKIIVADRNWLSSVAYQGIAGKLGADTVLKETRRYLPKAYITPTFTILLYLSRAQREVMLQQRGTSDQDYFESQTDSFQQAILKGYEEAGKLVGSLRIGNSPYPYATVPADGTPQDVHSRLVQKLEENNII